MLKKPSSKALNITIATYFNLQFEKTKRPQLTQSNFEPFQAGKDHSETGKKGQMFPEIFKPFQLVLANKKYICKMNFFLTKTSKF